MARKACAKCGTQAGFLGSMRWTDIHGKDYCSSCAQDYVRQGIAGIIATTSDGIHNHDVVRYIDIDSVEIVIGSGIFSEFTGDISDFFGARSSAFEQKLQLAKRTALDRLKFNAFLRGGNAVIAIDLDYTEFSGNRIGVIANGTIVEVKKLWSR